MPNCGDFFFSLTDCAVCMSSCLFSCCLLVKITGNATEEGSEKKESAEEKVDSPEAFRDSAE